jgi:hypothetical protein
MPVPAAVVWAADPHTLAKHRLLRDYLAAWLPTLLHGGFPGVTYAEGFAGPGIYRGGEPGSPVIALRAFLGQRNLLAAGRTVGMVLAEEDGRRLTIDPDLGPLTRSLLAVLGRGPRTLAELKDHALVETVYRPPHARMVVQTLLKQGAVEREPTALFGADMRSDNPGKRRGYLDRAHQPGSTASSVRRSPSLGRAKPSMKVSISRPRESTPRNLGAPANPALSR